MDSWTASRKCLSPRGDRSRNPRLSGAVATEPDGAHANTPIQARQDRLALQQSYQTAASGGANRSWERSPISGSGAAGGDFEGVWGLTEKLLSEACNHASSCRRVAWHEDCS